MKHLFYLLIILVVTSSCVSTKLYEDVKTKNDALQLENRSLMAQLDTLSGGNDFSSKRLTREVSRLKSEKSRLQMELDAVKNNLKQLQSSYDALEANSAENLSENLQRNRDLLKQLEEKEKRLNEESFRLQKLEEDLTLRANRIKELEAIIAAKDEQMKSLKNAISKALTDFEGKGLTVEQLNGKVYVSMENKLLFTSGSWQVNKRGEEAVKLLGNVLAKNPDIAVLIEGHTDNVPYSGNGNIRDNWDLSTKRATAIVAILSQNTSLIKSNLTAAGRGEYAPVASNDTPEGRAQNRRIEVILTPKLDKLTELLEE